MFTILLSSDIVPPLALNVTTYSLSVTFTVIVFVLFDFVPVIVIVVVPMATPVTLPVESTVAISSSLDVNVYVSSIEFLFVISINSLEFFLIFITSFDIFAASIDIFHLANNSISPVGT